MCNNIIPEVEEIFKGVTGRVVLLFVPLYMLSLIFVETNTLNRVVNFFVGTPQSHVAWFRLFLPVMFLSVFVNNSPLCALCIPIVVGLSERVGKYSANVYLMVLPFAIGIGGVATVLGYVPTLFAFGWMNDAAQGKYVCLQTEVSIQFQDRIEKVSLSPQQYADGWPDVQIKNVAESVKTHLLIMLQADPSDAVSGRERAEGAWLSLEQHLKQEKREGVSQAMLTNCEMSLVDPVIVICGFVGCVTSLFGLWYVMYRLAADEDAKKELLQKQKDEEDAEETDPLAAAGAGGADPSRGSLARYQELVSSSRGGGLKGSEPKLLAASYTVSYIIPPQLSEFVGCSVSASPAALAKGVKIVEVNYRSDFNPAQELAPNDTLTVQAPLSGVMMLRRQFPHLRPRTKLYQLLGGGRELRQLFQVATTPEFFGEDFDKTEFFLRYSAACIGVDETRKLLLVEADMESFPVDIKNREGILLVSPVPASSPQRSTTLADNLKGWTVLVLFFVLLILSIVGGFDTAGPFGIFDYNAQMQLFFFALAVFGGLLGIVTFEQALRAIPISTLMVFMFAPSISISVKKTGVSDLLASFVMQLCGGSVQIFFLVFYAVLCIITQFIDSSTLVSVLIPTLAGICNELRLPTKIGIVLLCFCANSCFLTPIGSPYNYITDRAGDYKFFDWFRAGWVLQASNGLTVVGFFILWVKVTGCDQSSEAARGALLPP